MQSIKQKREKALAMLEARLKDPKNASKLKLLGRDPTDDELNSYRFYLKAEITNLKKKLGLKVEEEAVEAAPQPKPKKAKKQKQQMEASA